jgi:exosortase/archaeosortase family protein|tara:strand:- start:1341 stop:1949 length:609 start_codon:yes stop_codon:yes gene_type:complete
MKNKLIKNILIRYLALLVLGVSNLLLFYLIFTPLTFYPVLWALQSLYDAVLSTGSITLTCSTINSIPFLSNLLSSIACLDTTILFKGYYASIIPACIAGSAYYLLLILNLSTPMPRKTRIKSILFLISTFLILNILRIIFFANLFVTKGYAYFDLAHTATWYFGSTVLVISIWFSNVLIFKINKIPIYTDLRNISRLIKNKK